MADRHLFVGDSITAYYGWPENVVAARPGAVAVARSPVDTINSPAYGGTTLMNTGGTSVLGAWSTRVAPYLTQCDRCYFHLGVNDIYYMARLASPTRDIGDWRAALNTTNANVLAASPRPARVYLIGTPWITGIATNLATLPVWMRGDIRVARTLMDRVTRDAAARFGWTYISLGGMSPDQQQDGIHPNDAGVTYYTNQVVAAG